MFRFVLYLVASILISTPALAAPADNIPPPLQPWTSWVLEKHPDIQCPFLYNSGQRQCLYPSAFRLDATASGATFTYEIELYRAGWVQLPGSDAFWPTNVRSQSKTVQVRRQEQQPQAWLEAGKHQLSGNFQWNTLPRSITVPAATGILQVNIDGEAIVSPEVDREQQLWLSETQQESSTATTDNLETRVFRLLDDNIPLTVTTRLELNVSGREREMLLGPLLLPGFAPQRLDTNLPAKLEDDGSLRIQVKPGRHIVTLVAHQLSATPTLTFTPANESWPNQEVWVFSAHRDLRTVQLQGASPIDPSQTGLPAEWQQLPAYLVTAESNITLEELQRGSMAATANQLSLQKDLWLDFSGEGFTVRDIIRGNFSGTARLDSLAPYQPGSAMLNGEPQVITHLNGVDNSNGGVEIRERNPELIALSRLETTGEFPVSGWQQDFSSVDARLHLSPGWSLIDASGVSNISGSWVSKWSLWDIFLVLIITVTLTRLTSPWIGALALATLLLVYHRVNAPVFIWLNIAATLALLPLVTGQFRKFLQGYNMFSFILLTLICLPFAVNEARQFFYPQLDMPYRNISQPDYAYEPPPVASSAYDEPMAMDESAMKMTRSMATPAPMNEGSNKIPLSQQYDPSQQTQTGPGLPQWQWQVVNLSWSGPVISSDTTRLYLVSPLLNRFGHLLSALLPLLLGGILLQRSMPAAIALASRLKLHRAATALAPLFLGSLLLAQPESVTANTVMIDKELLSELETRLTQAPSCLPDCASIESGTLQLADDQLNLSLTVHAADTIAFPLPSQAGQWRPDRVSVNGQPAALAHDQNQQLLTALTAGTHVISIQISLEKRDEITLQFPLPAHNLRLDIQGWQVAGNRSNTNIATSLQLTRDIAPSDAADREERLTPGRIAPFVQVIRTLNLGLEWTVITHVQRVAPAQGVINLDIPLLAGESPVSGEATADRKMAVRLSADAQTARWESVLKISDQIQLQAPTSVPWTEVWQLQSSPVWHIASEGIPSLQRDGEQLATFWKPWPGESVTIDVQRPSAIEGNHLTINSINLTYKPGQRATNSQLQISIKANQAGQYSFTLPEGARLESLHIDQRAQPLNQTSGTIKIPLRPGEQTLQLNWQSSEGFAIKTSTPLIELGTAGHNQALTIEVPADRWVLLTGGPAIGPAILIWGIIAVILLIAVALGRSRLTPLKTWEWILLALGIATINLYALAFVAVWMILLDRRGKLEHLPTAQNFKWMQFGLFALSVITLGFLLASIPLGLLSNPEMYITGNGSSSWYLQWYQDKTDNLLSQAWVISLPMGYYRLAMLLWSLWLAFALIRWCKWGWQQLGHQALWYVPGSEKTAPEEKAEDKPEPTL